MQLNSDLNIINAIKERLRITGGYCPCVPESEWNEDTKCVCKNMRENNECHCGLFVE